MTEFPRPVALDRLGAAGDLLTVEARPDELPALATRLQIPAVRRLSCRFRLRRTEAGVIEATGELEAEVTQVCVLSLEEFDQLVRESFAFEFVPQGSEADDADPDSVDQIPYVGNAIDLGEAAAEQLALALDPYPRRPGTTAGTDVSDEPRGAFAGLAALRPKQ